MRLGGQECMPGHFGLGRNFPNPAYAKSLQLYTSYNCALFSAPQFSLQGCDPHKDMNSANLCTEWASANVCLNECHLHQLNDFSQAFCRQPERGLLVSLHKGKNQGSQELRDYL